MLQELFIINNGVSSIGDKPIQEISQVDVAKDYKYCSNDNTKLSSGLFQPNRKILKTFDVKNLKKVWEVIASAMQFLTSENITMKIGGKCYKETIKNVLTIRQKVDPDENIVFLGK